ncbi:unnamed protein product [Amoebophrya sp. A25]|nr:unnamed protein product [Amoebophrya sp. A25]|eukprot:GSA25T00009939001.1
MIGLGEDLELDEEEVEAMNRCGYSEEEALAFKGVYAHYDTSFGKGDGKCSVPLVKSMVRALGIQMQKKDEDTLAVLLDECDENKDGSCQFPEFLLLIHKMQEINFCNMNQAAAERVESEKKAIERKEKAEARKKKEKEAHRSSLVMAEEQAAVQAEVLKKANENKKVKSEEDESEDEREGLKEYDEKTDGIFSEQYDEKTDGAYPYFYWKNHKAQVDEWANSWKKYLAAVKAR